MFDLFKDVRYRKFRQIHFDSLNYMQSAIFASVRKVLTIQLINRIYWINICEVK